MYWYFGHVERQICNEEGIENKNDLYLDESIFSNRNRARRIQSNAKNLKIDFEEFLCDFVSGMRLLDSRCRCLLVK